MEQLFEISNRLIESANVSFYRSLYKNIDWNDRLIEIRGARGVGKTTLMLQKAKELTEAGKKVLYISMDTPYFYKNMLCDTAEHFFKYGGEYLFVDEVHKYPQKQKKIDWASELKSIYDTIPALFVCYSGSSILQLYKSQGDLSRRKSSYFLNGLSFKEYLYLYNQYKVDSFTLDEIIANHETIGKNIISEIKILPAFDDYLKHGFYPFYRENPNKYYERLSEVINVIIETDIPFISDVAFETLFKLKQLLSAVATSVPYTINLSNISSNLYITDQRTLLKYLNLLEKAELVLTLSAKAIGNNILSKPQKVYLNNTNLMYALDASNIQVGSLRETFFINQLRTTHKVNYPKTGDFIIDDKFIFEVGGKNKGFSQIANIENSYLAVADIEIG
ncbi:MAG TPA: AAA family ATPase, partial [Bacteroidales bacterium]|nr:AAA family ATPase [Bacteroidales bacterium]